MFSNIQKPDHIYSNRSYWSTSHCFCDTYHSIQPKAVCRQALGNRRKAVAEAQILGESNPMEGRMIRYRRKGRKHRK